VPDPLPIVLRLQKDTLNSNESVGKLLRVAKAVAFKLELQEPLNWIDRELEGYAGVPWNDLPTYRVLYGVPEALNPYTGWQSILFAKSEKSDLWARVPITESISSLEQSMAVSKGGGKWSYSPPPSIKAMYAEALDWRVDVRITLSRGALSSVVEAVRLLILNWTLALEKAGIVGSEMTFSSAEKDNAGSVTHQFFVQNLSYVSDVSGSAKVTTQQTAKLELDIGQIGRRRASHQNPAVPSRRYSETTGASARRSGQGNKNTSSR
jgi:hypothetical protein